MNGSGSLIMRAEKVGAETMLARIVQTGGRGPAQTGADATTRRRRGRLVRSVVIAAAVAASVLGFFGPAPSLAYG